MQNQDCSHCFLILSSSIQEFQELYSSFPLDQTCRANKILSNLQSLLSSLESSPSVHLSNLSLEDQIKSIDKQIGFLATESSALKVQLRIKDQKKVEEFLSVRNSAIPFKSRLLSKDELRNAQIAKIMEERKKFLAKGGEKK